MSYLFIFLADTRSSPQNVGEAQASMEERAYTLPYFNTSSPLRGVYGQPFGTSPYMPYNGGVLSGNYPSLSANLGHPLVYPTSLSLPSPLIRSMTSPALNSSLHGDIGLSQHSLSQSVSTPTLAGATTLKTSPDCQTTTTTIGATGGHSLNSLPSSGFGANLSGNYEQYNLTQRAGHTSVLPDPPLIASALPRLHQGSWTSTGASRTSLDIDQNKHITSLLHEIDLQRQETKRVNLTFPFQYYQC